ncbi:13749_t:CDS:2, partial [Dentiscutata erythropus]
PKRGGGLKQNQQNIPRMKQIPIKQRPVIKEDQIRDDQIIGDQAKQIIQPKIPIPRQISIPVLEPQLDRGPDELWRNVLPENILRPPDAIALQRYREIQVNDNRIPQQIVIEEEEFDQQDVLDCPICYISLYEGGNVIQLCNNQHMPHYIYEDCCMRWYRMPNVAQTCIVCFQPLLRRRVGRNHILQIMRQNQDQRLNLEQARR